MIQSRKQYLIKKQVRNASGSEHQFANIVFATQF